MPKTKWVFFLLIASNLLWANSYSQPIKNKVVFVQGGESELGWTAKQAQAFNQIYNRVIQKPNPQKVRLKSFYINAYEVTNAAYCDFLNAKGNSSEEVSCYFCAEWTHECKALSKIKLRDGKYVTEPGFENHPVMCVNWYGANAYCQWAGGRLPTKAEFEYAAKGGQLSKNLLFSGSDNSEGFVVYGKRGPLSVGSKKPNELGLYDMSGNMDEWCSDWYSENMISEITLNNPQGPSEGILKVVSTGSWRSLQDLFCMTPSMGASKPHLTGATRGFRVCFDKKPSK